MTFRALRPRKGNKGKKIFLKKQKQIQKYLSGQIKRTSPSTKTESYSFHEEDSSPTEEKRDLRRSEGKGQTPPFSLKKRS